MSRQVRPRKAFHARRLGRVLMLGGVSLGHDDAVFKACLSGPCRTWPSANEDGHSPCGLDGADARALLPSFACLMAGGNAWIQAQGRSATGPNRRSNTLTTACHQAPVAEAWQRICTPGLSSFPRRPVGSAMGLTSGIWHVVAPESDGPGCLNTLPEGVCQGLLIISMDDAALAASRPQGL